LLLFGAESFVLQFTAQKYEDYVIWNSDFACYFIWVWSWSLTLREERRLRAFENKVLRRIFGPKRTR
jgi:hypothetical protein